MRFFEMDTQGLSRKSRDELNNNLLTLYRKLTIKPTLFLEPEEKVQEEKREKEDEGDLSGEDIKEVTAAIGIGI